MIPANPRLNTQAVHLVLATQTNDFSKLIDGFRKKL